jgi:hypothetical protein
MSIGLTYSQVQTQRRQKAEKLNWCKKLMHAFSLVNIGNLKYSAINKKAPHERRFFIWFYLRI